MNKAKQLLQAWAKVGVTDPEQLRKLLVKRSLQPLSGTLLQTLVDCVACFGGGGQSLPPCMHGQSHARSQHWQWHM